MIKLFFDIETLPAAEEKREMVLKILKKRNNKKNVNGSYKSDEELHRNTSFEGTFGRICCIGYIKENRKVKKEVISGDEREILEKFWEVAADVDLFIGHNVFDFDLPFILKRSVILGVKPSNRRISFIRYRNDVIFDTMYVWEQWAFGNKQSLDTLAKVLGLPTSKDEMDGSMVWDYFQAGKIDEICKYCMKDVELTRKVYYKMTFEDMPSEQDDLPF